MDFLWAWNWGAFWPALTAALICAAIISHDLDVLYTRLAERMERELLANTERATRIPFPEFPPTDPVAWSKEYRRQHGG